MIYINRVYKKKVLVRKKVIFTMYVEGYIIPELFIAKDGKFMYIRECREDFIEEIESKLNEFGFVINDLMDILNSYNMFYRQYDIETVSWSYIDVQERMVEDITRNG